MLTQEKTISTLNLNTRQDLVSKLVNPFLEDNIKGGSLFAVIEGISINKETPFKSIYKYNLFKLTFHTYPEKTYTFTDSLISAPFDGIIKFSAFPNLEDCIKKVTKYANTGEDSLFDYKENFYGYFNPVSKNILSVWGDNNFKELPYFKYIFDTIKIGYIIDDDLKSLLTYLTILKI